MWACMGSHGMHWDSYNVNLEGKSRTTMGLQDNMGHDGTDSMVASQGFEPRLIGSEPTVLPLNEEATGYAGAADLRSSCHKSRPLPALSSVRVHHDSVKPSRAKMPAWTTRSAFSSSKPPAPSSSR